VQRFGTLNVMQRTLMSFYLLLAILILEERPISTIPVVFHHEALHTQLGPGILSKNERR
jgi:hypothetical protein